MCIRDSINEDLYDHDFVEKWCYGFDELTGRVQEYPPAKVAEITWVPEDQIAVSYTHLDVYKRQELAGVTDVLTKSLGTNNAMNIVKAAAEGLKNMQSPQEVAARRNMSVGQIFGWKESE